ncbi:protein GntX [Klebsiella pneumoniae subsp. rhinoscleromatis]|nr:protein GntX [Klebsiella pneumoniae subsp. rhinoscleromatis]
MSFIRYRSLFTGQKAKYANSTQLMLAMPNAAGSRPLGDLLPLQPRPARLSPALPAVRPAGGGIRPPCGRCLQKPPPWHRLVAVNDYRPPLSGLVQQLKFHHRPELAPPSRVCCCSAFCSVTICRQ